MLVSENRARINSMVAQIEADIKRLLGVKWVDLLVWNNNELKKKRRTVFYFDLCFKHLLLKGDGKSIAQILQPFAQERIGTYDFFCMYHTRLWPLCHYC